MESNESPQGENPVIPTQNNLYSALSKAQASFPPIPKDTEVKVYSKPPNRTLLYTYWYADLTTIIDAVRKPLTDNGLSFSQNYVKTDIGVGIATFLYHSSGEYLMTGFVPCQIQGMDMKQIAGQYTYAKRISLTASLGISGDDDMDAASIEGEQGNSTDRAPRASKQEIKNHAPGGDQTESRWEALRTDKPKSKLDVLLDTVREKKIPFEAMPEIIKKSTGLKAKSSDLTDEQIDLVLRYVNLLGGSK